jgi:hypothetical protein
LQKRRPQESVGGAVFLGGQVTARMSPKERVPEWQKTDIYYCQLKYLLYLCGNGLPANWQAEPLWQ